MLSLIRNLTEQWRWYLVGFSVGFLLLGTLALLVFIFTSPFGRSLEQIQANSTNDSHRANTEASHAPTSGVRVPLSDFANLVSSLGDQVRFSRNLILYDYLADASLEELVEIGGSTLDVQPSSLRHQIQTAIVRRMRLEDFESAMNMLSTVSESLRDTLTTETFAEWAKIDLNAATDHARELDEINRLHALRGIFLGSKGLSRSQLSAIAQTLGHEEEFDDHIALEVIEEGLDSPANVWREFLSEFGDSLGELSETQRHVLVEIAVAWITDDELGAIQAIRQLPEIEPGGQSIAASIVSRIAKDDLAYALALSTELGIRNRNTLVEALESVVEQDPQSAFLAVSNYEMQGTRLMLQRFVLEAWADADPLGLIEFLDSLPKDLRLWGEEKAFLGLARIDPEHAAESIQTLKRQSSRKSVALEIVRYWTRIDPLGAFRWSGSDLSVSAWKTDLQEIIMKVLAEEDPDLALELALGQHVAENEVGLEATLIESLVEIDIDKGMEVLEHTRNQPTRETSLNVIGNALIVRGRSDQALKLVEEESADFQYAYFDSFAFTWAYFDPADLYSKIESLPTDAVKKRLAERLAMMHNNQKFLSPEQVDGLRKYLSSRAQGLLQ